MGRIFEGELGYTEERTNLDKIPDTKTKVMLNLADPDSALRWWRLPIDGIGLARMEFTITEHVKAHPMALAHPERLSDPETKEQVLQLSRHFKVSQHLDLSK